MMSGGPEMAPSGAMVTPVPPSSPPELDVDVPDPEDPEDAPLLDAPPPLPLVPELPPLLSEPPPPPDPEPLPPEEFKPLPLTSGPVVLLDEQPMTTARLTNAAIVVSFMVQLTP
jgi:hypothetical protein